jgi:hypothetical protein
MLCHPLPAAYRSAAAEDPIVAEIRRLEAEAAHLRARYTANNNFVAMRTFNAPPPFKAFGMTGPLPTSLSSSLDSSSPPRGLFANTGVVFR